MAPTKLFNDHVTFEEYFPNVHCMVASYIVICDSFIFRIVFFIDGTQKFAQVFEGPYSLSLTLTILISIAAEKR